MPDRPQCPGCASELKEDAEYLFCAKCGFIISTTWLIKTLNILEKNKIEDKKELTTNEC